MNQKQHLETERAVESFDHFKVFKVVILPFFKYMVHTTRLSLVYWSLGNIQAMFHTISSLFPMRCSVPHFPPAEF